MRPRLREEDLVSVPWSSIVHGRHFSKFIDHISNVINLFSVLHWPVGSNECERGQFKESPTSALSIPFPATFVSAPSCPTKGFHLDPAWLYLSYELYWQIRLKMDRKHLVSNIRKIYRK